jgi:hypothetical protein
MPISHQMLSAHSLMQLIYANHKFTMTSNVFHFSSPLHHLKLNEGWHKEAWSAEKREEQLNYL